MDPRQLELLSDPNPAPAADCPQRHAAEVPSELQTQLQVAAVPNAEHWLQWCEQAVEWRTEHIQLFGRSVRVPRQVAWFGDPGQRYRYSGTDHHAAGWPEALVPLRDWCRSQYAMDYNFVLLNRYRDGQDSMGWHADDEPELLGDVCSVSLGATRRFLLDGPLQRHRFNLTHGMALRIPRDWRHAIPKTARPVAPRINLTFRTLR